MVSVERTFTVNQPMGAVVDYLKDFAHTESWDPGTKTCRRTDSSGDIGVGARWHNVSEFRGKEVELDYELARLEPQHLTFVGRNSSATSTDDLTFEPQGAGGTSITYRANLEFSGLLRLVGPFVKPGFEKLANETVDQLTGVLNGL